MNPHAFALLMLGVVAVALGFSGYYFQMAVEQARPILPAPLQDGKFAARFALDRFIWSGTGAAAARRSYLRSHIFGCIAFIGMMALVASSDSAPVAVWLFAGVTVFAFAVTLRALAPLSRLLAKKGRPPRGTGGGQRHGSRPVPRTQGRAEKTSLYDPEQRAPTPRRD